MQKWMGDLLGSRYPKHHDTVERLGHQIATTRDLQAFGQLAAELFEAGYMRCLSECRSKLEDRGFVVTIERNSAGSQTDGK